MTKEIMQQIEDKMKKTVDLMAKDLTTLRAGQGDPGPAGQVLHRLLRYTDADQPGSYHLRA